MEANSITAVILTKNEQSLLPGCLNSLSWCSKILIVDSGSTDATLDIARKAGAEIIHTSTPSFAERRNLGLEKVTTAWLLYIDADERVSPPLATELLNISTQSEYVAASFERQNYFLGHKMQAGGWENERITRFFKRTAISEWTGLIHESPHFDGLVADCSASLWHFSHRTVREGLAKSASWTFQEAELLAAAQSSKVSPLTVVRKGLGEFVRRGIQHRAWKDGSAGWMELFIQVVNRMLVYIQVWELQQQPPISKQYQDLEEKMASMWKRS